MYLLLHLLPYLDLKTVLNCRQVSQEWSEIIDKNKRFWIRWSQRKSILIQKLSQAVAKLFAIFSRIGKTFSITSKKTSILTDWKSLSALYKLLMSTWDVRNMSIDWKKSWIQCKSKLWVDVTNLYTSFQRALWISIAKQITRVLYFTLLAIMATLSLWNSL